MAVLQILKMGHPILRKKASKVKNFEEVSELILNMKQKKKVRKAPEPEEERPSKSSSRAKAVSS